MVFICKEINKWACYISSSSSSSSVNISKVIYFHLSKLKFILLYIFFKFGCKNLIYGFNS